MRIPSTSDLVYAQTNKAYDKLAVLSENLDKLEEIYDFIFKYKEYIHTILESYISNNHLLGGETSPSALEKDVVNVPYDIKTNKVVLPHNSDDNFYGELFVDSIGEDSHGAILRVLDSEGTELGRIAVGVNEDNQVIVSVPDPVDATSAINLRYLEDNYKTIIVDQCAEYIDELVAEIYENVNNNYCTNETYESLHARVEELETQVTDLQDKLDEIGQGGGSTGSSGVSIIGYAPTKTVYTLEEFTGGCKLNVEYLKSKIDQSSASLGTTSTLYSNGQIYESYEVSGNIITFTNPIDLGSDTYVCIVDSSITASFRERTEVNYIYNNNGTQGTIVTTQNTYYSTPTGFKVSRKAVFNKI